MISLCSILELVRTPVVKQSLLRGTAHFVPTAVADEEVPPPAWPKTLRRGEGPRKFEKAGSYTAACPVPILGINMDLRSCEPKAMPRNRPSTTIELVRNWCGDNFKFFFGGYFNNSYSPMDTKDMSAPEICTCARIRFPALIPGRTVSNFLAKVPE